MKKAISAATSAALLASLLATAVAPAALASISQTSAGNVAQGTTTAGTATFLFTENAADALAAAADSMTVTITDALGANTVTWAGTPVVSAPSSLGASVSIAGNVLTISIRNSDVNNVETISITGLKVQAASNAAPGEVLATLSAGPMETAFQSATVKATGKLAQAYGIGTTSFAVANDVGSCSFSGTRNVTVGGETLTGITVSGAGVPVAGQQTIDSNASAASHLANEVVSQTVDNCNPSALASPATVVEAGQYTSAGNPTVYAGENNSRAGNLRVTEPSVAFFADGTTLTFTIATAGVVFSRAPRVVVSDCVSIAALGASSAVLSGDRKSVTVTVTGVSECAGAYIELQGIQYDLAANVPAGTFVSVGLALSGGLLANPATRTNAVVYRGITASAPMPTVYIGENNQATGLVTLTEQGAGFFQAGTGDNNVIEVCDDGVYWDFSGAPWAKVTAGDLRLRDGSTASTTNIVEGTISESFDGANYVYCYSWTIWTGSTVASTIVIGNSTFSSGPLINVDTDQAPGVVALNIWSGPLNGCGPVLTGCDKVATVGFATAVYRNQVVVTALSQPVIPAGAADVKVGDIQVAETAIGQLKIGEDICVEVLPRASNEMIQDTFLKSYLTADLPTVTATGGLIVSPVNYSGSDCRAQQNGTPTPTPVPGANNHMMSFSFTVLQQSLNGTGKLVMSNMHVITTADAPAGPVLFNVFGWGGNPTWLEFQSTVSPAKIGVAPKISIGAVSALGLNPTSGYTAKTPKTQVKGKYITWKFTGGTALAGQRVNVLVAMKVNGAWGGPKYLKSAVADANGIVTFAWKSSSAATINVRVQWPGSTTRGVSTSKALGGSWK